MIAAASTQLARARHALRVALNGPQGLAFMPALTLGAFWLGGEGALIGLAFGLPALLVLIAAAPRRSTPDDRPVSAPIALADAIAQLDALALRAGAERRDVGCVMLDVDGIGAVTRQAGMRAADLLRDQVATRLRAGIRAGDRVVRLGDSRFLLTVGPGRRLDVETMLQLATRLQSAVEEPAWIDESQRALSVSIGFCTVQQIRQPATGEGLFRAAQEALDTARAHGASTIRAWTPAIADALAARRRLVRDLQDAFDSGQIRPWFQPQVCTSTGQVSGMEALARWIHPDRGVVAPGEFLACLAEAGQMQTLGDVMLRDSLDALTRWEKAGVRVPMVSVNFSAGDLGQPGFVDRVTWALDRAGLTPDRLGIEILETDIDAASASALTSTLGRLSSLGCTIDLDDFGTGQASLAALGGLRIDRVKIDRRYVMRIDRDADQRRMLLAMLGFAERLGLATVAEGVESTGEHALLAQLGCDHVQGYGIARPMPAAQVPEFVADHTARIADPPSFGRGSS